MNILLCAYFFVCSLQKKSHIFWKFFLFDCSHFSTFFALSVTYCFQFYDFLAKGCVTRIGAHKQSYDVIKSCRMYIILYFMMHNRLKLFTITVPCNSQLGLSFVFKSDFNDYYIVVINIFENFTIIIGTVSQNTNTVSRFMLELNI